ncbi:flagellar hook-length control protein FliK [Clostridium sp.]|uniref:flagellar hook-length control protein FliK n=1 Tax=Clostridium sp. TaxID=1506 RepID=UPI0032162A15
MVDIGQVVNVDFKNNSNKTSGFNSKTSKEKQLSKDDFTRQLENVGKNNKVKDNSVKKNQDTATKDNVSNKKDVDNKDVDNKEVDAKDIVNQEDLKSLIDIIISLMNVNKEESFKPEVLTNDLNVKIDNLNVGDLQYILELIGSGEASQNLLSLLDDMSSNSEVKDTFLNLMNVISQDEEFLKENSSLLKDIFTGSDRTEKGDLINQLQGLVKLNTEGRNQSTGKVDEIVSLNVQDKPTDVDIEKSYNNTENNQKQDGANKKDEFSKESDILSKVINGNEKDSKVTRVADFMSVFENNILDIESVSNEKPIAMSKSDLNNDVIKALAYMDKNGIKDLTVKIYPKELGEVCISVSMEQGTLKAMVKATSKEAVEMLSLGLKDINEKINNTDIKIQSVDIGLYEEDTTYFAQQHEGKNSSKGNGTEKKNGELEEDMNVEGVVSETSAKYKGEIDLLV